MRKRIHDREMDADGHDIGVTVSVGYATLIPNDSMDPKSLIGAADEALYRAKSDGRDRVVGFEDDPD